MGNPEERNITWSDYIKYRAQLRGFELSKLESIIRYSAERYRDSETGRSIAIGKYNNQLVMIPYELIENEIKPITVHAISRQQINFRLKTERFINE